jgi:hypothetical protein
MEHKKHMPLILKEQLNVDSKVGKLNPFSDENKEVD